MQKYLKRSEIRDLYDNNEDLREYVEKYRQRDKISVEEALTHAMVWEKAKDIMYRANN